MSQPTIAIIFNPTARGEKAGKLRSALSQFEGLAALQPTKGPGDARILACRAVQEGFTTVVAAGGDGTVNEVVNGVLDAGDGPARARLGLLPVGTINVFAKELGIPERVSAAWEILRSGHERRIDLPYAEFSVKGEEQRRYFVQLAGAGIDSAALARVRWDLKKMIGPLAYIWAGLQAMREPGPPVTISAPGVHHTSPLIIIGNGRFYGGRFPALPFATMTDGKLDVTIALRVNWPVIVRGFTRLLCNRFGGCPDVIHLQSSGFTLTSTHPIPFQLEGDIVGELPARFGIVPMGLRVVVPPT